MFNNCAGQAGKKGIRISQVRPKFLSRPANCCTGNAVFGYSPLKQRQFLPSRIYLKTEKLVYCLNTVSFNEKNHSVFFGAVHIFRLCLV